MHAEAETLWTKEQVKPKPIRIRTDEKGKFRQWDIDAKDWQKIYEDAEKQADKHISSKHTKETEQATHTRRIGIEEVAADNGKLYAQWSMAAEAAQALANEGQQIKGSQKGRGLTPCYKWVNGFDKSADEPIQQMQWGLKSSKAE